MSAEKKRNEFIADTTRAHSVGLSSNQKRGRDEKTGGLYMCVRALEGATVCTASERRRLLNLLHHHMSRHTTTRLYNDHSMFNYIDKARRLIHKSLF